jgi:hypothetical protein
LEGPEGITDAMSQGLGDAGGTGEAVHAGAQGPNDGFPPINPANFDHR